MTLVAYAFAVAVAAGVLGAVVAVAVPERARPAVSGMGTALAGAAGVTAGVAALAGQSFSLALPGILPLAGVSFTLDALGGLFVAVTGGVAIVTGIYSVSYTRGLA